MNKLLVAVFGTEVAADAGLNALSALHACGDITLYATGVLVKDAAGGTSVRKSMQAGSVGTATGLAVGSLIGLLGGPAGMVVGALTGTALGAVRDFWVAGVGLDFIEEALRRLEPGTVALVAEIEEEWVVPVDLAIEKAGGHVLRRTRTEVAEAQFDHDITAFKAEIQELESEASHASGAAKAKVQAKLAAARSSLSDAVHRAKQRVVALKHEADAKAESLTEQLGQVKGDVRAKIDNRMTRVKGTYHARAARLAQAWNLTKEAFAG